MERVLRRGSRIESLLSESQRNILTLGQAALLAGLPQRPVSYSPVQHLDAALRRRSDVLSRMIAAEKITEAQKTEAEAQPLHVLTPHIQT